MDYDYGKVESVSDDAFKKASADCATRLADATVSDKEDLNKIERLLDLQEGTLKGRFCFQKANCERCGRLLTSYDFVYTSIVDAGHPKSFVVHTLVGSKHILNKPRKVRCSSCNTVTTRNWYYMMENYGCCE
jgi:hypothetical protein